MPPTRPQCVLPTAFLSIETVNLGEHPQTLMFVPVRCEQTLVNVKKRPDSLAFPVAGHTCMRYD